MRKSRFSWYKQQRLIKHFVAGTTARCATDLVAVNRNTLAYYFHRLRIVISHHFLPTSIITSMASRISGTRPSDICEDLMVFPKNISRYF